MLGLGCDPHNRGAVDKILWLKQRSLDKGLILLVEDLAAIEQLSHPLSAKLRLEITAAQKNSPTTWVVPANDAVPTWITGTHEGVAVRIPQHDTARALCQAGGAIVSTSANISTHPVATTSRELRDWFGPHLDYVLEGAPGTGVASEVRALMGAKVYRHGS
ncbi:MAG: L-threonylcarbamoyladenylate synthase [Gammaproteobacteria bacterium]|nr:L-threonylcarbamoyladenylate synthase [Gammaproteobacteria bacterium]